MSRVVEIVKAGGIKRTQGAGVNTGKAQLATSAQARAIGAGVNGMERGRNTMATEGAGKGNVRAGVGGPAKAGGTDHTLFFLRATTPFSRHVNKCRNMVSIMYMKVPPKAK